MNPGAGVALDTRLAVETPEAIDLYLAVAGPAPRALAWLIDFAIRAAVFLAIAIPLAVFGDFGAGLLLILAFAAEWLYPMVFEVLRNGATPGKRVLGLRVVHDNGTPVGWQAAAVRNLLRAVDLLPLVYGFGLATMLVRRDFKRLGDLAAGTVVVHDAARRSHPTLAPGPALAPARSLRPDEQRTLIELAERQGRLSAARFDELAALVPLGADRDTDRAATVAALARWLAGARDRPTA